MNTNIKMPKKLIEVALPLDDINVAAAREKSIRHGHPSTFHLWWARRPLAAVRAVLFAQMVNDPGGERGWTSTKTKTQAAQEREKLFDIIRNLVKWENTNNEVVLSQARTAIKKSWEETCELNKGKSGFDPEKLPAFHDPFSGGGAIPLEAQRLGLESYASDLNPVAVVINKAMIEIPPMFSDVSPIGPIPDDENDRSIGSFESWKGAEGVAEDVRRYGRVLRNKAWEKIGSFYPEIKVSDKNNGQKATVIAWIWVRTVKSPNPAYNHLNVPLSSTFLLSTKKNKIAWVEIVTEKDSYDFITKTGVPDNMAKTKKGTKIGRGNFECIFSGVAISNEYIDKEANEGRMGRRLMAVVAEGPNGRLYLPPDKNMERIGLEATPGWSPKVKCFGTGGSNATGRRFGFNSFSDYFLPRQLVALETFSDGLSQLHDKIFKDGLAAGWKDDGLSLASGGTGPKAYAEAISVYLAIAIDRSADSWSTLTSWISQRETIRNTFARQVFPMTWDFTEVNPFSNSTGNFMQSILWVTKSIQLFPATNKSYSEQHDALTQSIGLNKIISTDPPYYDNIGYADLADFFYVWLRKNLKDIYPNLFSTIATPKCEELVALPYRHSSKKDAEEFFLKGMTAVMTRLSDQHNPTFPVTLYYAFKQSETKEAGTSSTGWEAFLNAVIKSGFCITGTWPIRTERATRTVGIKKNSLASSIILICRKRDEFAESASRRKFQRQLREKMPEALEAMLGGSEGVSPIVPVDLAQAAIGPGMAIFSTYRAVLNQDGSNMSVHDALILINRVITEYLNPDSGNFDADTLFCDEWFSQFGWGEGQFGEANVLAQAKGTTVDGAADAGVLISGAGKVRLLKWSEYPSNWDPKTDKRTPIWEACHQIIRVLNQQGETEAGALLARMPERGETIRQLAYHLYTQCERKKWAEEARSYNELIGSWRAIVSASHEVDARGEHQYEFDF